jgi:hypothetical protein
VLQAVIFDWAGTTVDYGSCAPVAVEPGAWTPDLEHYRGALTVALRIE